jgi:hypothetical protein
MIAVFWYADGRRQEWPIVRPLHTQALITGGDYPDRWGSYIRTEFARSDKPDSRGRWHYMELSPDRPLILVGRD